MAHDFNFDTLIWITGGVLLALSGSFSVVDMTYCRHFTHKWEAQHSALGKHSETSVWKKFIFPPTVCQLEHKPWTTAPYKTMERPLHSNREIYCALALWSYVIMEVAVKPRVSSDLRSGALINLTGCGRDRLGMQCHTHTRLFQKLLCCDCFGKRPWGECSIFSLLAYWVTSLSYEQSLNACVHLLYTHKNTCTHTYVV